MPEFKSKTVVTTILDPRQNYEKTNIETEIRFDPLTNETRRLAHFGAMIRMEKDDFSSLDTPEARKFCPFCPENIEKVTPRFPPELIGEGFLKLGQVRVISNIAPYDQYSALTIMGPKHLVTLKEFTVSLLKDSFQAGVEFCRLVAKKEQELPYNIIAWNYMTPSGGGLAHPHQQVIITDFPGNLIRKNLECSKEYYQRHGKNYWEELCRVEEEKGERYVAKLGRGHWLIPYAQLGVLGEYMVVFPELHTIHDLQEEGIEDLAEGLVRVFAYLDSQNIYSFNMGLYFAPAGEAENYFSLHARIVPRVYLNLTQKPPDTNILHIILQEPYSVLWPEELCSNLKPSFEK
jgi:UDPglucose--hexose-1-phosphate uridylyltransferase